MTRGNARELAVHLIYGREFTGDPPIEAIRLRLEEGYYENLAAEYEIYTERPTGKQVKYLEDIVAGVHAHEEELNAIEQRAAQSEEQSGEWEKLAALKAQMEKED